MSLVKVLVFQIVCFQQRNQNTFNLFTKLAVAILRKVTFLKVPLTQYRVIGLIQELMKEVQNPTIRTQCQKRL